MPQITLNTHEVLLSPEEIADHMQVSRRTVMRWIKSGQLAALRIGTVTRIPADAYQQFLSEHFFSAQSLRVPPNLAQQLLADSQQEEPEEAHEQAASGAA